MRYCPTCRIDYDDEIDDCAVCGGPLVEGTSREYYEDISEEDWVELDPLGSLGHSRLVLEALEEEKVACYIEAVYGGGDSGGYSASVMVTDNNFELALELQQSIAPPDDDDLLMDPDADDF